VAQQEQLLHAQEFLLLYMLFVHAAADHVCCAPGRACCPGVGLSLQHSTWSGGNPAQSHKLQSELCIPACTNATVIGTKLRLWNSWRSQFKVHLCLTHMTYTLPSPHTCTSVAVMGTKLCFRNSLRSSFGSPSAPASFHLSRTLRAVF
jgi:hypothetical protein